MEFILKSAAFLYNQLGPPLYIHNASEQINSFYQKLCNHYRDYSDIITLCNRLEDIVLLSPSENLENVYSSQNTINIQNHPQGTITSQQNAPNHTAKVLSSKLA